MSMASKLWKEYGILLIVMAVIAAYCFSVFYTYLTGKSFLGIELNSGMDNQYKNGNGAANSGEGFAPSQPLGQNDVFASANGMTTSTPGLASTCTKPNVQNIADLLPSDTNSQWAKMNPIGQGNLEHVNLVSAGYHVGINTVGQSLRNANQQLRSEPPNPQMPTGPWNASTMEPDLMRPPLTIGCGSQ